MKEQEQEQFATYKIALALKELGFEKKCFGWWAWINGDAASLYEYKISNSELNALNNHKNNCAAPLWQEVIDWFLSEHQLSIEPYSRISSGWPGSESDSIEFSYKIISLNPKYQNYDDEFNMKYSRYGAIHRGIYKAIEICRNKI